MIKDQSKEFEGKTLLITGAAQGVGKEISNLFAEQGANVFISDINPILLAELDNSLKVKGFNSSFINCDVSNVKEVSEMVDNAIKIFGKIDFLVNNAAVSLTKKMMDLTEKDWDKVLDVNVKGTFFVTIKTAKKMIEKNVKGSIINIASIAGQKGRPNFLSYGASKAAVLNITMSAAIELAQYGIRVNAISPGTVDTSMWVRISEEISEMEKISVNEIKKNWINKIPLKRLATPGDIANAALFLCSDRAAYITGQSLNVCGGLSLF